VKMARLLVFVSIATSLLIGAHAYLGWRLITPARLAPPWSLLAWSALALSVAIHPTSFLVRAIVRPTWGDALSWVSYVAMGFFSLVLCLTVARDVGWMLAKVGNALPADPARRDALLTALNLGILGAASGLAGIGFVEATRRARIVDVTVPLPNLAPGLEGLRIAQITDVHIGPTIKGDYRRKVVDAVNEIDADIVAVTGDLVDGTVEQLREHVAPLGALRGKLGVFFVTGNHEYYSGAEAWCAHVEELGLTVLQNEHRVFERGGARLVVGGVTDYNAGSINPSHESDAAKAAEGAPADALRILLAHQPRSAKAARDAGFHLQLSGHTHGGQFIPWNLFVPLQQPFTAGLHKLDELFVYVSRGTGYWGPPIRLGAPSEITRITLARA